MAKEVEEFLKDLNGENKEDEFHKQDELDLFGENKEEEKPTEDTTEPEEEEMEEKPLPFHKDPKIQRYVQREIAKALEGQTPRQVVQATEKVDESQSEDELIAAFTQIIGNDTPEKQHALRMLERGLKKIEEKALSAKHEIEMERQAEAEAERELVTGLAQIEDNYDVDITSTTPQAKKLRTEFIEFVERIAPKDEYGNVKEYPDFESSFELFRQINTRPTTGSDKAKQLAARSMARSSDAQLAMKPQGNSWSDIERFFSKLEDK